MKDKIIDKLRKLLALAARGGTEAEAAAAMAKAQELLAAHHLTMADVKEPEAAKVTKEAFNTGARMGWKDFLYSAAAQLCFCNVVKGNGRVFVIGKPVDIAAAHGLAQYLIRTCEHLTEQQPSGRAYRHAFRLGFTSRVRQRVDKMIEEAKRPKANSETGTELILHPLYARAEKENQAFLHETFGTPLTPARRPSFSSSEGFRSGRAAGDSVSLSTNVIGAPSARAAITGGK